MAPRHPEAAGERHPRFDHQHSAGEQVRLPPCKPPERDLAAKDQRDQVVRGGHERERRPAHHGGVEVAGYPQRVVREDVDLLRAQRDAGDSAEEAEHHHRKHGARKARITPRRRAQPPEESLRVTAEPHAELHPRGHREAVHHRREHRHVHEVRCVDDLPRGTEARVHQKVVRRRHRDEQDVEHERRAAHFLVEDHGAHGQRAHHVPDRDHRRDVDLLRRVAQRPPDELVPLRVDGRDDPHGPEQRRDVDQRAMYERDDRYDRRRHRAIHHEWHRAFVRLLAFGDRERGEELPHHAERAHREHDDAGVEQRVRLQRRIRRVQHVGPAAPLHRLHRQHAGEHQSEVEPPEPRRRRSRIEQHRAREPEHGHLEVDDEENEHVHAVHAEQAIVPRRRKEMHGLPAREHEQQRRDGTYQERHYRHDGVGTNEKLGLTVDAPPREWADPRSFDRTGREPGRERKRGRGHRDTSRRCAASTSADRTDARTLSATFFPSGSTTITRPTMVWCPMPQNSLQMMRKSPLSVGVTRSA